MKLTRPVVVEILEISEDIVRIDEPNNRSNEGIRNCKDKYILGESTFSINVVALDVDVDDDGDEDGVEKLCENGLDGQANLIVVVGVDLFNNCHVLYDF